MDKIIINGGKPLNGEVRISGAKNAALPILAASFLTEGTSTYTNVPKLQDIHSIKLLLSHLGARIETDADRIQIDTRNARGHEAPYDLVRKMRASVLVLGPMLARLKKAKVSLPGGCAIGARPIDLHLKGLEQLGARISLEHGDVEAETDGLKGGEINFDLVTVTGTENLMMAACLAEGTTVLNNAAREPEVVALAETLNRMGANILGAGTAVITIEGVSSLNPVTMEIIPDRIEAGTLMVAAALTHGDVLITHCEPEHLGAVIDKLKVAGADITIGDHTIRVKGPDTIQSADIQTMPYPGFPTDMQAQYMVLMCVADGSSLINETIFEKRLIHVSELLRMGADITISGQTALVRGISSLSGAPVMASDLRASASLILAGLVATGETVVNRVYHLDRGYDALDKKLAGLGADIRREK
ncbi:MAG: UDP-N-acetylglucosamine 1-carboxyvinyltransferase [Deltaproteobacteria bacterium]|nr:MAG: UDP-N-acetylglucosamine 1-carboxyvinyltransferase [Deltaproteobacteria bacterium]